MLDIFLKMLYNIYIWINLYPSKRMEQVTLQNVSVRYERQRLLYGIIISNTFQDC